MTVRAKVRRDGPGEWSWTVGDEQGEVVAGVHPSWAQALAAANAELIIVDVIEPVLRPATPAAAYATAVRPGWRRWLGLP